MPHHSTSLPPRRNPNLQIAVEVTNETLTPWSINPKDILIAEVSSVLQFNSLAVLSKEGGGVDIRKLAPCNCANGHTQSDNIHVVEPVQLSTGFLSDIEAVHARCTSIAALHLVGYVHTIERLLEVVPV